MHRWNAIYIHKILWMDESEKIWRKVKNEYKYFAIKKEKSEYEKWFSNEIYDNNSTSHLNIECFYVLSYSRSRFSIMPLLSNIHCGALKKQSINFKVYFQMCISEGFSNQISNVNTTFC